MVYKLLFVGSFRLLRMYTVHCLNLTLSTACKQPQIRNAHGIVGEVAAFFNRSAKRVAIFHDCVAELAPESQKKRQVQLCETRWVERHDAVITFVQLYPSILAAVEKCESLDANTGAKACMPAHSIRKENGRCRQYSQRASTKQSSFGVVQIKEHQSHFRCGVAE